MACMSEMVVLIFITLILYPQDEPERFDTGARPMIRMLVKQGCQPDNVARSAVLMLPDNETSCAIVLCTIG
jgi:hypothetical protein